VGRRGVDLVRLAAIDNADVVMVQVIDRCTT
jgi:hypothetical protein